MLRCCVDIRHNVVFFSCWFRLERRIHQRHLSWRTTIGRPASASGIAINIGPSWTIVSMNSVYQCVRVSRHSQTWLYLMFTCFCLCERLSIGCIDHYRICRSTMIYLHFEHTWDVPAIAICTAQVAHMKGSVVKSSHIFQGWSVNPQLENAPGRTGRMGRTGRTRRTGRTNAGSDGCCFRVRQSYGKKQREKNNKNLKLDVLLI